MEENINNFFKSAGSTNLQLSFSIIISTDIVDFVPKFKLE